MSTLRNPNFVHNMCSLVLFSHLSFAVMVWIANNLKQKLVIVKVAATIDLETYNKPSVYYKM